MAVSVLPSIDVTDAERGAERLSDAHLHAATEALRLHGCLVLHNAVDVAHLDALRAVMTRESEWLLRCASIAPGLFWSANGRLPGHLQQSVPRSGRHVFRDVVCNPLANQVTSAWLGPGAFYDFAVHNCNVNCPGSVDQQVHSDPGPPRSLIVNIPLRDVTEDDGAIELWPGTHVLESGDGTPLATNVVEQRRAEVAGPVRGVTNKGSVLIRDFALWHRGRANPGRELRHMIAILHYPARGDEHPWYWQDGPAQFAAHCRPLFDGSPIRPNVSFTRLPVVYQLAGPRYELEQAVREHPMFGRVTRTLERAQRFIARR